MYDITCSYVFKKNNEGKKMVRDVRLRTEVIFAGETNKRPINEKSRNELRLKDVLYLVVLEA